MATFTCSCGKVSEIPVEVAPVKSPHRPGEGTLTGQVWSLCDALAGSLNRRPTRKEVAVAGALKGLNPATVATQTQKWLASVGKDLPVVAPTVTAPAGVVVAPDVSAPEQVATA